MGGSPGLQQGDILTFCGYEPGTQSAVGQAWNISGSYVYGQESTVRSGNGALCVDCSFGTRVGYSDLYAVDNETNSNADLFDETEIYVTFWFNPDTISTTGADADFFEAKTTTGGRSVALFLDSDGVIYAKGPTGNTLGTGSTELSTGTWYEIQVRIKRTSAGLGMTDGEVEVIVDGTEEFDETGDTSATNIGYLRIGKSTSSLGIGAVKYYYDDVIVSNFQFYSGWKVSSVARPNAEGNYTAWLGNPTRIDEEHDGGTPPLYPSDRETLAISTDKNSTSDRYESDIIDPGDATVGCETDCPTENAQILAARFDWYSHMNGSPPAYTTVKFFLRVNDTDYKPGTGASLAENSEYPNYSLIAIIDPDSGDDWSMSAFDSDNVEHGMHNVSTSGVQARVSSMHLSLLWKEASAKRVRIGAHAGL